MYSYLLYLYLTLTYLTFDKEHSYTQRYVHAVAYTRSDTLEVYHCGCAFLWKCMFVWCALRVLKFLMMKLRTLSSC